MWTDDKASCLCALVCDLANTASCQDSYLVSFVRVDDDDVHLYSASVHAERRIEENRKHSRHNRKQKRGASYWSGYKGQLKK